MTVPVASTFDWIINGLWWVMIGGASVVLLGGLVVGAIESWRKKRKNAAK